MDNSATQVSFMRKVPIIQMQETRPRKANKGNLPMLTGLLNRSSGRSSLILILIKEAFIIAKTTKTPSVVISASVPISFTKTNKQLTVATTIIALKGVLRFSLTIFRKEGRILSFAIPYKKRELAVIIIRTVLMVANKAMKESKTPASEPRTTSATAVNGSGEEPSSFHGTTLMATTANNTYTTVVMIDRINDSLRYALFRLNDFLPEIDQTFKSDVCKENQGDSPEHT